MSSAPPRRVLAGFVLEETGDGRRALDAARAREFDLILLEVMLPGLDGVLS